MEVAADAKVGQRHLAGPEDLTRADDGVVLRMVKVIGVTDIGTNLRREKFCCIGSVDGAGIAVEPGEIGKGKRLRMWTLRIGDLRLCFTEVGRRNGGLRRCGVMGLGLGRVGLPQLKELFLDLFQLVLQVLNLLVLRCPGIFHRCLQIGGLLLCVCIACGQHQPHSKGQPEQRHSPAGRLPCLFHVTSPFWRPSPKSSMRSDRRST